MIPYELPFEIRKDDRTGIAMATNGRTTVTCTLPNIIVKRRAIRPGQPNMAEMIYVQTSGCERVYVRQYADGSVVVNVTKAEIYP
jgi:hypothetical protein